MYRLRGGKPFRACVRARVVCVFVCVCSCACVRVCVCACVSCPVPVPAAPLDVRPLDCRLRLRRLVKED